MQFPSNKKSLLKSVPVVFIYIKNTSLHHILPLLLVDVEGLQRAFHLTVLSYNSYSVQFIFPSISSASVLPRSVGVFLCISSLVF